MELNFKIHKNYIQVYHTLLIEKWSFNTLIEMLSFLESQLLEAGLNINDYINKNDNLEFRNIFDTFSPQNIQFSHKSSSNTFKIIMYKTYLVLSLPDVFQNVSIQMNKEYKFFNDCRSILFQCVIFYLLPKLKDYNMRRIERPLIDILNMYVNKYWQYNPAQQHYLKSLICYINGDKENEGNELFKSFLNTKPSDHDYITRAYDYYRYLIEKGKTKKSKNFISNLFDTTITNTYNRKVINGILQAFQ